MISSARALLTTCAEEFRSVLGDRLLAAYALGSLAHGGYAPAVSDLDLALVLAEASAQDGELIEVTWHRLRERHPKLSVFWSSLPALRDRRADGRFPSVDRLDLAEHGLLLLGTNMLDQVARPESAELLLDSARFAVRLLSTDEVLAEFREPDRLLMDPVRFTKSVLFPVRFRYSGSLATARAAGNDEAIAWYLALPTAPATSLVRLAAAVRNGEPLDPVSARPALLAGLRPLYLGYVGDQLVRLASLGAPEELVTAFTEWRAKLAD
jgi:predicted nucleotidyltransferase